MKKGALINTISLIYKMISYNLKIIFANRFIWFMTGAILFYMGMAVIYALQVDNPKQGDLFEVHLICGLLIVFYPAVFGIQNDQDARTIEILFGIPDYRYKVWLVRIMLIFAIGFLIMLLFTTISSLMLVKMQSLYMTAQVMAPILFLGMMAFMVSTMVRNGNGTAVIMIIFGLIFMIMSEPLRKSQWNILMNPFTPAWDVSETAWHIIAIKNRIILVTGSVIFLLGALYNLQKREKFM
jgi:hypothetical protein